MRRIIIAAILTVISAVGVGTSFAVNDLPNFGEWMKTNEQQFRKTHRHDGPNMHMNQHMMDGNNKMMPQDGMGRNNGQYMHQNGQMTPQGQSGQIGQQGQPGQMPQGGQPNGNVPQPSVEQGASQTTQNQ